jgi:enoyl-CoA hydratase/carnithine racemase
MLRFAIENRSFLQLQKHTFAIARTVGNIDFYQEDSFLKVVLNRPKALNALDLTMIKDIDSQLPAIASNKAFWIEGAGGKAFCAGGDIKALFDKGATIENRLAFFRH